MHWISQLIFAIFLAVGIEFFRRSVLKIKRNINIGRDEKINDQTKERWKQTFLVALGQSKMVRRPVAGFFHILIYAGFVARNERLANQRRHHHTRGRNCFDGRFVIHECFRASIATSWCHGIARIFSCKLLFDTFVFGLFYIYASCSGKRILVVSFCGNFDIPQLLTIL